MYLPFGQCKMRTADQIKNADKVQNADCKLGTNQLRFSIYCVCLVAFTILIYSLRGIEIPASFYKQFLGDPLL